jgi:hypothetical protein
MELVDSEHATAEGRDQLSDAVGFKGAGTEH